MQDHGPSVSVHFVCAFVCARCLCPLVASIASIRDDSIGLLLMPMMPSGYASKLSFKAQSGSQHAGAQEHFPACRSTGARERALGFVCAFVCALCLCPLVASIRDDSIGLLLMPIRFKHTHVSKLKAGLLLMPIRFKAQS